MKLTEKDLMTAGIHPATAQVLRWFAADHLPAGPIRDASVACQQLAIDMAELPPSPELTVGLRKLLEAKDCFVRCAVGTVNPGE